MSPPITIGRDEARRRAEEELAKAKYQGLPTWLQDLLGWLEDRLTDFAELIRLANRIPSSSGPGEFNWIYLLVVIVVVVAIVLMGWKFGLPTWRRRIKDATVSADPEQSPDDYRSIADRAAAAQEWTVAVRERFRALVRELEERTIIDPRPARTALEAAGTSARMLPAVEPELHEGALLFNDVMYGERVADQPGYERMVAIDVAVRTAANTFRHSDEDEDDLLEAPVAV
ncbi:MAG: DUF4129 domain-containing protein [Propionibacteriales bacterium]|nr:DUF4129 domain-containing protein [Propionibacteriales bacterium]